MTAPTPGREALPDFAHDSDRSVHGMLLARGYRLFGYDTFKKGWLYGRRFHEREADRDGQKCSVCVVRHDMRPYSNYPRDRDPISYEVEIYAERRIDGAALLKLYTFPCDELTARIGELEAACLAVWDVLTRADAQEKQE